MKLTRSGPFSRERAGFHLAVSGVTEEQGQIFRS
jgi:hypothetical protein